MHTNLSFFVRCDGKIKEQKQNCAHSPPKNNPKLRFSPLSLFVTTTKVQDVEAQILVWGGRDSAVLFFSFVFWKMLMQWKCGGGREEGGRWRVHKSPNIRNETTAQWPLYLEQMPLVFSFLALLLWNLFLHCFVFLPHLPGCKYQVKRLDYFKKFKTKIVAHLNILFPSGLFFFFFFHCCCLLLFACAPTLPSWIRCRPICSYGYLCFSVQACVTGRVLSM